MSRHTQHRCYGAQDRFEVLASYIYDYYGGQVRYIADVNFQAVPVESWSDPDRKHLLDMSHAMLRAVSPIHIQFAPVRHK